MKKLISILVILVLALGLVSCGNSGAKDSDIDKIKKEGAGPVPVHLMDASRDAQALGHGQGYKYPHNYPEHHIKQQYLPKSVDGGFYVPSDQGYEKIIRERMAHWGHLIESGGNK